MECQGLRGWLNEACNRSKSSSRSEAPEEISTYILTHYLPSGTIHCPRWRWKPDALVYSRSTDDPKSCEFSFAVFCRAPGVDHGVINKTQMWQDLFMLWRSIQINSGCTGRRASQTFFRAEGGWLKPGSVSMAPAWFQQAHEVRTSNMKVKQ